MAAPSAAVIDTLNTSPFIEVTRRVDIYEFDAETPFITDAALEGGSVTCDGGSQEERRNLTLALNNKDHSLDRYPEGLWYDKVVKPFRGFYFMDGSVKTHIEWQLGEFLIESIDSACFPSTVAILGRDYVSKLVADEFGYATSFVTGLVVEDVIKAIALNGGITKFRLPVTGKVTGKTWSFEGDTHRWKAISEIAKSYGYDIYFDAEGYLTMREQTDPDTTEPVFEFRADSVFSNLAHFRKGLSKARLYNHIVVTGETSSGIPVVAIAENLNPDSPSNVTRIGRRTYRYTSSFISTLTQAQDVANKLLAVHALEEYDIKLSGLVVPWLEATDIVRFVDPDPDPADIEQRFFLHDFTIPLGLELMEASGKRVVIVG